MKKILCVFGTRPEAIKMAPVVKALEEHDGLQSIVCVTAQHRNMLDEVLNTFGIKPHYDLDIMKSGQTLNYITVEVLNKMEEIVKKEQPDLVLVHGDTTSAMAAAIASFYEHIAIGHVEAGLRTYKKYSPFPEEINRQFIDKVADLLFAPTELNRRNLSKDLNDGQKIIVTGNTVIDALKTTVREEYNNKDFEWVGDSKMILLTAHRRENFGEPMRNIFTAVKNIVNELPNVKVIYPVHPNPEVRKVAMEMLGDEEKIKLIEPLDVIDFHNYMNRSDLILTDSGGVQEEAPSLHKPVLVLRDTTERPEGIEAGTLKLVGTSVREIVSEVKLLLTDYKEYAQMSVANNPYGDGMASRKIVNAIADYFGL